MHKHKSFTGDIDMAWSITYGMYVRGEAELGSGQKQLVGTESVGNAVTHHVWAGEGLN